MIDKLINIFKKSNGSTQTVMENQTLAECVNDLIEMEVARKVSDQPDIIAVTLDTNEEGVSLCCPIDMSEVETPTDLARIIFMSILQMKEGSFEHLVDTAGVIKSNENKYRDKISELIDEHHDRKIQDMDNKSIVESYHKQAKTFSKHKMNRRFKTAYRGSRYQR